MDAKFIIDFQGSEFVLFEGLLAEFHANGGESIETEEVPNSTATCPMFKAKVSGAKGTYTGHGDADNTNVNSMISKHKYRMAETRAIARALRWYNNIGMCSKDELGGDDNKEDNKVEIPSQIKKVFPSATPVVATTPSPVATGATPVNPVVDLESPAEKLKNYKKPNQGDMCEHCGGEIVKNPKTGKTFCANKCWLPENAHFRIKEEKVIDIDDDIKEQPFGKDVEPPTEFLKD